MDDKLRLQDQNAVKGIPKDDEALTRSFILKSPSEGLQYISWHIYK